MTTEVSMRVSVMPVQAGSRWSQRPRLISAAAARKTSRARYSRPRQRRSDQAVGQMPDRLLHQGAQPGLATVVGAFGGGALIFGAPVAGRRVPVRPSLGQPSKPSVDQGGDLGIIQDLVDPRKGQQVVLVAAARPALGQIGQVGHEGPVGVADPKLGDLAQQQRGTVADLGLGNPDHPPCPPVRQTVQQHRADRVQPDLQRQRPGAAPAGWPG